MKKIILLLTASLFLGTSFATIVLPPKLKANEIFIPIGKSDKKISLLQLSTISVKDIQSITGRKMSFLQRFSLKEMQKKLVKSIASDGTIENKKIEKFFARKDGTTGFNGGGFALGFFLNGLGVIIAYLIDDEAKKNRVKWAWIGFGASIAIWVLLYAVVIASVGL